MSFITALIMFALLTIILVGNEIFFTYATLGFKFGFSANREPVEKSALAKRIANTYKNQVEAAAYGVPILAAAAITGLQGNGVETAALLFVLGRLAFSILYYTGMPFVRVPAFLVANVSLIYICYYLLVGSM